MSSGLRPKYCWDSSVAIAWLKGDVCHDLPNIDAVVRQVDSDAADLVIPVIVWTEVLCGELTDDAKTALDAMAHRPNVITADITMEIARKAAEIRRAGYPPPKKKRIPVADAYIMATAIVHRADALHAVDGTDLLCLDKSATVNGLSITKPVPHGGQQSLPVR